jgi:hypothetical protein
LASARRSFVAALEYSIHLAMQPDRKLDELPTSIGILRNLKAPVALIALGQPAVDGVWHEVRLIFAPSDALSGDTASGAFAAASQRMQVWAYLPAITIPLLGDLLADRLDVTPKAAMLAQGWQPYSIDVGGKWYSYRRLDPFASLLGPVADFVLGAGPILPQASSPAS